MAGFCIKCGAPLQNGVNFCQKCGAKIEQPLIQQTSTAPVSTQPQTTYAPVQQKNQI